MDGLSLCRLCVDAFSVSGKLGLVSQHIPRLRLVRQQHLETCVGHPACRRSQASGDSPSARDFQVSPSEWYRWEKDLRQNPDIDILLSIDSTSFPLGTGPKLNEIWHSGYYPVVWTNKNYKMIYLNMGHNDIDYEHKYDTTNRTLSYTLNNPIQDRLIIDGLLWLGRY